MHAFYHDTVESIVAHANECSPLLRLQHVNGGQYQRISARAIIQYFEDTWGYRGAYPEFFIVGDGEEISWALDMEATFATALERKPEGFFMLVGYNDGRAFLSGLRADAVSDQRRAPSYLQTRHVFARIAVVVSNRR